jgi:branched-chain amino acid aminotransferase
MGLIIYLDGEFVEEKDAKISVFDHGLLYGDGVFEGIREYSGKIFKLDGHIDRLFMSAHAIDLNIPVSKEQIKNIICQTLKKNNLMDGYIRVVVTRGIGDLGLDPKKCPKPTIFVIAGKIQLYPEKLYNNGLSIITVPTRRNLSESLNPAIKSLNYLNNILAKIEANNVGVMEGLLLNNEGFVTECTGENIFALSKNILFTPPVSAGALDGITRSCVIEIGQNMNLTVKQENITRYDLYNAEECFLSGTAAEIIPVAKIDGRIIGTGKCGKITKQIREMFKKVVIEDGYPVY